MNTYRKNLWHEDIKKKKSAKKRKRSRYKKREKVNKRNTDLAKSLKYATGKNPENLTDYQKICIDQVKDYFIIQRCSEHINLKRLYD